MVLVSLDPFASRRIILVIAALLGFSALCFADPVLMAQRYRTKVPADQSTDAGLSERGERSDLPPLRVVDSTGRAQAFFPLGEGPETTLFPPPSCVLFHGRMR